MLKKDCPCPNEKCSIRGNCIECVKAHSEKGFIPYCIYVKNGEKITNPNCACSNHTCSRHGLCEECVRHHGQKGNLPSCLR